MSYEIIFIFTFPHILPKMLEYLNLIENRLNFLKIKQFTF